MLASVLYLVFSRSNSQVEFFSRVDQDSAKSSSTGADGDPPGALEVLLLVDATRSSMLASPHDVNNRQYVSLRAYKLQ